MDIATTLGAGINHGTMVDDMGDASGEIVREVQVFTEAETVVQNGVRVATGGVQVILQWSDETVVSTEIEIEGFDVTSLPRPPGQPDVGDPDGNIESIELRVPPTAYDGDPDYWVYTEVAEDPC